MKIAVCLAGNFRNHEQAHPYWKERLYDVHDCDVFLSTWDFVGNKLHTNPRRASYHEYDYLHTIPYEIDELKSRFNFKGVEVEKYHPDFYNRFLAETAFVEYNKRMRFGYDPGRDNNHAQSHITYASFLSQWYKRWRVFELMSIYALHHKVQYDYVIVSRPDYWVELDVTVLDTAQLIAPRLNDKNSPDVHDVYASGPMNLIREYCNLYPRFHKLAPLWNIGQEILIHSNILHRYLHHIHLPHILTYNNMHGVMCHSTVANQWTHE